MNDVIIFGVDPGATTGIAVFWRDRFRGFNEVKATEVGRWLESYCSEALKSSIHVSPYFVFAVERYNIGMNTVKKTRQTDALTVTGAVESVALSYHGTSTRQNASDAKKIGSRDMLERIPGYEHVSVHTQDAASQVVMVLAKLFPEVIEPWIVW